jgi:hypothetical protein
VDLDFCTRKVPGPRVTEAPDGADTKCMAALTRRPARGVVNGSEGAPMRYSKPIRRHHVKSSAVRSMGYDEEDWVLQVEYVNGDVYNYFRVPPQEHRAFVDAPSKGTHVNREIKPYYEFEKLETAAA